MTSVPSKVRNCAETPDHLRSGISFLRACNIPYLISYTYGVALSKRLASLVYIRGSQSFFSLSTPES